LVARCFRRHLTRDDFQGYAGLLWPHDLAATTTLFRGAANRPAQNRIGECVSKDSNGSDGDTDSEPATPQFCYTLGDACELSANSVGQGSFPNEHNTANAKLLHQAKLIGHRANQDATLHVQRTEASKFIVTHLVGVTGLDWDSVKSWTVSEVFTYLRSFDDRAKSDNIEEIEKNNDESYDPVNEPPKITWDVARNFVPLHSECSQLWKSSLQRLRQQFLDAVDSDSKLVCLVTQSIIPEWPKRPEGPFPSEIQGLRAVGSGTGPRREPEQLFLRMDGDGDTVVTGIGRLFQDNWQLKVIEPDYGCLMDGVMYWAFAADKAVPDIDGNPILSPSGKPSPIRQGCFRSHILYATKSNTRFNSLATEAGRVLYGIPSEVNRVLWRDWLDGFRTLHDNCMWTNAVFELAWQQHSGSSLRARKMAWNGNASVPLDALTHMRSRGDAGGPNEWLDEIGDPPAHWYSVIDDLVSASIAAIDILLSIESAREQLGTNDSSVSSGPSASAVEGEAKCKTPRSVSKIDPELLPGWLENADLVLRWYQANPSAPKDTKRNRAKSKWLDSIDNPCSAKTFDSIKANDRKYRGRHGFAGKNRTQAEAKRMQEKWVDALQKEMNRRDK